jgi:hypothetical protein
MAASSWRGSRTLHRNKGQVCALRLQCYMLLPNIGSKLFNKDPVGDQLGVKSREVFNFF